MRSPRRLASRSCSRATTSPRPTSRRPERHDNPRRSAAPPCPGAVQSLGFRRTGGRLMTLASAASGADLSLREHIVRTLRLAGPVMGSRAGLLVMTAVDTIMCGRLGAEALAFYGIALAPHLVFMLVGIGLMMGVVVLSAQADGAGRPQECGRIW